MPRNWTHASPSTATRKERQHEQARLTVGQALVRFLAAQRSERDGVEHRLIEGCFGIFGHGSLAGLGQALLQAELSQPGALRYYQARNEQAMVHAASGFARMRNRMSTLACTSSVGPGATNMVTGAALATVNRLPVLLLPSDVFATRVVDPVLQQLEHFGGRDVSVNDAFRPVSRFFDRVQRAEQLPAALLGAMRVLTDPAETGAATICLPEDVQTEAFDWPDDLFEPRVWHVPTTRGRPGFACPCGGDPARGPPPAPRSWWGCHLLRGHRSPEKLGRGHRDPRCRDPSREGLARLQPPPSRRCRRCDGHDRRQRACPRRPMSWSASGRAGRISPQRRGRPLPSTA